MKIAVYGNRHQDGYIEEVYEFLRFMSGRGDRLVVHQKVFQYLAENIGSGFEKTLDDAEVTASSDFTADLAVSIGGDGTFLKTAQWVGDKEIPILGVNTGHLGFLAPFTIDEARRAIADFQEGRARVEDRSLICAELPSGQVGTWPYALNEVAILKKDTASMITVDASVDRAPLAGYLCDGLIVSTPTGSTGYNLSVGGPIVQPSSQSMIISPIAAHSLTMRPLVIDDSAVLELRVTSRSSVCRVSLDGRSVNLPCGSTLFLTRAPFVVKAVQKADFNFFATIREKLLWGTTARQSVR